MKAFCGSLLFAVICAPFYLLAKGDDERAYELARGTQQAGERPAMFYEALRDGGNSVLPRYSVEVYENGLVVRHFPDKRDLCVMKNDVDRGLTELRASIASGELRKACDTWIVWTLGATDSVRLGWREGGNYRVCKVPSGALPRVLQSIASRSCQ